MEFSHIEYEKEYHVVFISDWNAVLFLFFRMSSVHSSEGVSRGFRGGCEGVRRGLGGVNLSKPPRNPQ